MAFLVRPGLKNLAQLRRPFQTGLIRPSKLRRYNSATTKPPCDPLRILFCGSDQFSINALCALQQERTQFPDTIQAIDVVCRPPKRVGAKLKKIREVPIKAVARDFSLPVHDVDTFTGWTPPNPFNLIIAVSFGLLVPKRLINAAKYGGLNLHPSLLPDFRGPAPLHHTLLHGERRTGVSLQTLHPERFDHGVILDQDAFEIPNPDECDVQTLTDLVSIRGANTLVEAIRNRVFVPPLKPVASWSDIPEESLRHAPKIHKEDMHVDWTQWTSEVVERRIRVLGSLWSFASAPSKEQDGTLKKTRVIFESLRPMGIKDEDLLLSALEKLGKTKHDISPGLPFAVAVEGGDGSTNGNQPIFVKACDDGFLRIDTVKVEGTKTAPAYRASMKAKLFADDSSADKHTTCGILYYRDTLS